MNELFAGICLLFSLGALVGFVVDKRHQRLALKAALARAATEKLEAERAAERAAERRRLEQEQQERKRPKVDPDTAHNFFGQLRSNDDERQETYK